MPDITAQTDSSAAPDTGATKPLLEIADLAVSFDNAVGARIQAVDGAYLSIYPRQTLAVVGESGCGKSVTAMSILQLNPSPPARYDRGSILFEGRDLLSLSEPEMRQIRGSDIAMIFQEPMTSLNPVYTIGDQIMEAILLHQEVSKSEARKIALDALKDVGIPEPERRIDQYPHQFSGGMRQRVMIAMALACQPKLLLADEPSTALDVTIQAQILELIDRLKVERDMAIMLITHDLGVVAENADVVCVMYAGRVVEYANVFELFEEPIHPYTRGLFNSIPKLGEMRDRLITISDVVNSPEEFQKLDAGIVPWWPGHEPPPDMAVSPGGDVHVLHEIKPNHWIGCWRTETLEGHRSRRPDLAFYKTEADVEMVTYDDGNGTQGGDGDS
ncbi:MAG: ABC transporter ATP-binding protein [Planctomycetes bacterium]|nr:ABC transporter ATP-binding protein [Planctomycetota bacterium]NOG52990.1 ABC transporter ATP-binding protein [Planctomycetota bacterium]